MTAGPKLYDRARMDIDLDEIAYVPSTGVRRVHDTPLIAATAATLAGYGCLVHGDPKAFPIEIVQWPAQGRRPIDKNSGDQGGIAEGLFEFSWRGETLYARNNAVGDSYLFGWSTFPEEATAAGAGRRASAHSSGAPTTTPMAASCSSRSGARASSCHSPCPAMR